MHMPSAYRADFLLQLTGMLCLTREPSAMASAQHAGQSAAADNLRGQYSRTSTSSCEPL